MDQYEEMVLKQVLKWKKNLLKRTNLLEKASKAVQNKMNDLIPDKVHDAITAAVKGIIQTTLFGLTYIPKGKPKHGISLQVRDEQANELLSKYRKIAAAEGAGTGAGGILLGLADFPALIAIKMKFLFELAHIYGYDTHDYKERLFLLQVFQLAFSSQEKRKELFGKIANWEEFSSTLPISDQYLETIDWEQFQREYRDSIDFRKMLQLVPGIGAIVGAWANYGLLDDLGEVGINCYRMRILKI
jgi:uncharacterized protein (DUF697 family)